MGWLPEPSFRGSHDASGMVPPTACAVTAVSQARPDLRLEQTCPHFVVVINASLCRTSLIHIVGSMVLCQLWILLACAWPLIRLHGDALDSHKLFNKSLCWSWMLRATCVLDVVFRHRTCVPDMSARVLG